MRVARVGVRDIVLPRLLRRPPEGRAGRARRALEDLGGTWIKLGQALALRFDLLPSDYCLEFFQLLNQVRPFPAEEVRRVLEKELGAPVEERFRSFDWSPVAAASIGQVHRAEMPDGTPVAVKVQRPGIAGIVRADLKLMRWAATLVDWTPFLRGKRARTVVDEFARWTREELDYRAEARHAIVLRRNAAGDPFERNPKIFPSHTTTRVLTMEYLDGIPVLDIVTASRRNDREFLDALASRGHDPRRIASRVVWNALNQIYRFGYFHADPHPANLIVLPGDAIGYVDFGIVGKLDRRATDSLRYFAQSLFADRTENAVEEFFRFLTPSRRTNVAQARRDFGDAMKTYVESSRVGPEGFALQEDIFEIEMLAIVRRHAMVLHPDAVRYLKAVLTAEALVKELDPQFDLTEHENRFFGRLMAIEAAESLRPRNFAHAMLDLRFRSARLFESIQSAAEAPHTVELVARDVRQRVQVFSVLTLLGWAGVIAAVWTSRPSGQAVLGVSIRALAVAGALVSLLLLVFSILQVRRLPADPGHSSSYPLR
jgi:predicted unusual protein kinase regulating ubiquinone biosynthesis (AarF/ABC1/UbiB family)